ncbi:MAG: hypothetical protein NPINA01_31090 [Nitrospinaceae bacterium]|nr:MAG: hypothetical protein NPINA01_31090 [Nitrospinaceae bacterium]
MKISKWEIAADSLATRAVYEKIESGTGCDCDHCKNFEKLGADVFPPEMHEIFRLLGIDFAKPVEVFRYCRLDSGLHSYGGWYHFIGSIVDGADCVQNCSVELERISDKASFGFSRQASLVHDSFPDHPVIQLDIDIEIPWVLNETEPD